MTIRAANRRRVREHRERCQRGICLYVVEDDASIIDLLVRTGWLLESEAYSKKKVDRALSAMLKDAAKH